MKQKSNFNPRSREGSDKVTKLSAHSNYKFQSTLPRRERQIQRRRTKICLGISIHAPAKGATSLTLFTSFSKKHFNPRSREGSDGTVSAQLHQESDFNPRSREGSDFLRTRPHGHPQVISIHAPAKGATFFSNCIFFCNSISIHAPAKGATIQQIPDCRIQSYFNPRSREGSDVSSSRSIL